MEPTTPTGSDLRVPISPSGFPNSVSPRSKLYRYPSMKNVRRNSLDLKEERPSFDNSLLWELMSTYLEIDVPSIQRRIVDHVEYTLARDRSSFDRFSAYQATAYHTLLCFR
jgi:hypothetical protein